MHSKYLSLYPEISLPHPSSSNLHFATDGDHYRKTQSKCRLLEPSPSGSIYIIVPILKDSRSLTEGEKRLNESGDLRVCCVIVSPGISRSCTHEVSPTWLPKHGLNKTKNRHTKENNWKTIGPQCYTKNFRQLRNTVSEKNNLQQEKNTNQLLNTKQLGKHSSSSI